MGKHVKNVEENFPEPLLSCSKPLVLQPALNPWDEKDFGVRVELTNQDVAFVRNIGSEPTLSHLFVKFLLDFGKALRGDVIRFPLRQSFIAMRHKSFEVFLEPWLFPFPLTEFLSG